DNHLHLSHQTFDLHVSDDRVEAVARAQVSRARLAAKTVDLARRDDAPVALVAIGPDSALPVPAAERVDTDPERLGRFADAVVLPRHFAIPLLGVRCSRRWTTPACPAIAHADDPGACSQVTYASPSLQWPGSQIEIAESPRSNAS